MAMQYWLAGREGVGPHGAEHAPATVDDADRHDHQPIRCVCSYTVLFMPAHRVAAESDFPNKDAIMRVVGVRTIVELMLNAVRGKRQAKTAILCCPSHLSQHDYGIY